jgi:hypothetical protein
LHKAEIKEKDDGQIGAEKHPLVDFDSQASPAKSASEKNSQMTLLNGFSDKGSKARVFRTMDIAEKAMKTSYRKQCSTLSSTEQES